MNLINLLKDLNTFTYIEALFSIHRIKASTTRQTTYSNAVKEARQKTYSNLHYRTCTNFVKSKLRNIKK